MTNLNISAKFAALQSLASATPSATGYPLAADVTAAADALSALDAAYQANPALP